MKQEKFDSISQIAGLVDTVSLVVIAASLVALAIMYYSMPCF